MSKYHKTLYTIKNSQIFTELKKMNLRCIIQQEFFWTRNSKSLLLSFLNSLLITQRKIFIVSNKSFDNTYIECLTTKDKILNIVKETYKKAYHSLRNIYGLKLNYSLQVDHSL